MTQHTAHFEASAGGMALSAAILLYQTESTGTHHGYDAPRAGASAFASIHPIVTEGAAQPTIGAGTALTRAHLRRWAEALDRAAPPEILPENVLVAHPDMLVWWVPAQTRSAYFALTSGAGLDVLSERTVKPVPYPAHLFVATRSNLGVYALPKSERPTADTQVLHSPILNVFIDGRLCWGNIQKPKRLTPSAIAEYESAVFDSWSTHPNPGQELTLKGKGGLLRLWDELAKGRTRSFPVKRLRPFTFAARSPAGRTRSTANVTVGELIAVETRR